MVRTLLIAGAVLAGSWVVLVVLAARLPAGLLKEAVGFLPNCVTMLRELRRDPRVPRRAKVAVVVAIAWVVSPIDLLPEFLPVIGPLDDVVAVVLLLRFAARHTPPEAIRDAWPGDPATLARLLGPSRPQPNEQADC